ncbi:MAG: PilZ domain-containing protein [Candidatus Omnitrophota bacterium]|jgi:hypothetical protein
MFTIVGLLFLALLSVILYMLYKNDSIRIRNGHHHARLEEYWNGKERRVHERFRDSLDVIYTVIKSAQIKKNGKTIDISEGGLKLLLDQKLSPNSILSLKVLLPDPKNEADLEGKVMWCEEDKNKDASGKRFFYHGIKLTAIREPSGRNFTNYLHSIASRQ